MIFFQKEKSHKRILFVWFKPLKAYLTKIKSSIFNEESESQTRKFQEAAVFFFRKSFYAFKWVQSDRAILIFNAFILLCQKKQVHQLSVLISLLLGELSKGDRQKIMTICTIDVHSRDVVLKLIQSKLESASAFQWQSQLRHRWDDDENDCFANICDAQFLYCYEYLGNTPRLVSLTKHRYLLSTYCINGNIPIGYNTTYGSMLYHTNAIVTLGDGWRTCW